MESGLRFFRDTWFGGRIQSGASCFAVKECDTSLERASVLIKLKGSLLWKHRPTSLLVSG